MVDRVPGNDISTNHLSVRNGNAETEHCSCPSCKRIGDIVHLMPKMIEALETFQESGKSTNSTFLKYYSVKQFAKLVDRSIETVRSWCIHQRINAEKCDAGHGNSRTWKIPATELSRYQNHGLLPAKYRY